VIIALLGFVAALVRPLMKVREISLSAGLMSQLAMALVCLIFVVLAVRSFVAARRSEG
jgi:hypothetical protein